MTDTANETPIARSDIESKFVELQDSMETKASSAKDTAVKAGLIALVVILILAFLLGRKRGRQGRTVIEVRRL